MTVPRNSLIHLQHGPVDCRIGLWGHPDELVAAEHQARSALPAILPALVAELAHLRTALPTLPPRGKIARAMHAACAAYADRFITPMAAVAGAIADHLLEAATAGRSLARAYVNNGGDIAVYVAKGEKMRVGMVADLTAPALDGTILLATPCGVATSGRACKGRGGRSFSFGIADAVSVVARTAAQADAAATIIANAVDLPQHPEVVRLPASEIDPDTDLGDRLITWDVGRLTRRDVATALDAGRRVADALVCEGRIDGAALMLRGQTVVCHLAHTALEAQ
jgi:ApbE superfamily uncharacterized protein (UPF0280 family)